MTLKQTLIVFAVTMTLVSGSSVPLVAQGRVTKEADAAAAKVRAKKVSETQVEFELMTGRQGPGVAAQKWGRVFNSLEVRLRIRRSVLDDKPEIKERMFGTIRKVTVRGILDRDGKIVFPARKFSLAETKPLKEWIRELETYGGQGSPEGQPLFGLNQSQFARVYAELSTVVENEVKGIALDEAVKKLKFNKSYEVRFADVAERYLKKSPQRRGLRQEYKGFAKGLALASILNEYGLGFRPTRTPEGNLELLVRPIEVSLDRWPIGWPLKVSNLKAAPKLYKIVPVELDKIPMQDVLDAASVASGVPILADYYNIAKEGVGIEKQEVSYPAKRTSWSLLLKGITNPLKLTRRVLVDENGTPFVWVTTIRANRTRL